MSSLKNKAISGASWSLTGRILQQGTQFIIGIVLARLLTPEEYGLVAMATVFIFISYVFVDSGFGSALIQKKSCSNKDYSTVFYLNLVISLVAFAGFYFSAPLIANFFVEPKLVNIVRALSALILLYAITIVQYSIITREVNFKFKTRIEFFAQISSGIIAIILAYKDYGVWALVWKTLLNQLFINIQLWLKSNWYPSLEFSKSSFHDLFSFSYKLLISGILDRTYQQLYRLVIGKFFPANELGFYTRAEQFKNLPSRAISSSLMSFFITCFSKMQDEPIRLKNAAKKVIKIVMFFNVNAMILMAIVAEPLINILLGDKWNGTISYLQLLVFVGVFYPMHAINVQILTALGRSDLFLRIEVIKKTISIPSILLGIFIGIKAMILGMIATSIIALAINTYYTNKLIKFGILEQLKCISKSLLIALFMTVTLSPIVFFGSNHINKITLLSIVTLSGFLIILIFSRLLKMEEYFEIKEIIKNIGNRNGSKK